MNQMAIEFGSLLCGGAIRLGFAGLRCYDQVSLQGFGWSAFALFAILAVLTAKWLAKPSPP